MTKGKNTSNEVKLDKNKGNKQSHHKVTWNAIYKDFKDRHPNLWKEVTYWRPLAFATIEIWLTDGSKMKYNYDEHKAEFISISE